MRQRNSRHAFSISRMTAAAAIAIAAASVAIAPAFAADDRPAFTKAIAASRIWGFLEIFRNSGLPDAMLSDAEVTMLIPIDTAFYRLTPEQYRTLLAPGNEDLAARYIRAHVVQGRYTIAELAAGDVKTIGGVEIKIASTASDGAATLNGCPVALADQTGTPGMFHLIDGFLFTPP